jgi:4-amino-4-deoxy-L-arabinose transferase-like glycosyltransferase
MSGRSKARRKRVAAKAASPPGPPVRPPRVVDPVLLGLCVLSLGVHLIGLDQPFLDLQAWRQADTAAVARNYYEEGYDLLYPRVDWRGDTPGYVEMEFPLYPYLVASLYPLVGGTREWIGRGTSALFSAATVPLLYALVRDFHGVNAARLACFMFVVAPLNVFYGRAFMPEAAMLFFSVGGVHFFARWTAGGGLWSFVAAAAFAALAFLVKLPTLYLGLPLLFLAWERFGRSLPRQPALWAYAALTLLPPVLWYWHAHTLFQQTHLTFGIWNRYGYAKWGNLDLLVSGEFYVLMFERLATVVFTPLGLALVVIGAAMKVASRRERLFHVWLVAIAIYVLLVPEGNRTLSYYQLPFVPPGAVLGAKALAWGVSAATRAMPALAGARPVLLVGALSALAVLGYVYARPLYAPLPYYIVQHEIGRELEALVPEDALLVVGEPDHNAGAPYRSQSPTLLYFSGRKGWQLLPEEFQNRDRLAMLASRGARFFLEPVHLDIGPDDASMSMVLRDAAGKPLRRFDKQATRE